MRVIVAGVAVASVVIVACATGQGGIEGTTSAFTTAEAVSSSSPPRMPRTGEMRTFADIEMVWIPPGEFRMGSSLSAPEIQRHYGIAGTAEASWEDELPQHTVRISRGFWMGRYEVTNAQFRQFVNATGHRTDAEKEGWAWGEGPEEEWIEVGGLNWRNPGWPIQDDQPVVSVSWNDAQAYVRWLSQKLGHEYRLPTEAEWEYACRAGTKGLYQWGHEIGSAEGWLNAADLTKSPEGGGWETPSDFSDGYFFPAPVGCFRANAWGLYDMHGNVWEWCQDRYAEKYPSGSVTDPTGPSSGSSRVNCGGSWNDFLASCRSAPRSGRSPGFRIALLGFRVCRDLSQDDAKMPTTAVATPAVPPPESSPSASGTPRTVETRTFAGIEMVWVPPGTFTMGSDPGEPGRKDDERQHPVTVARGFWLGRYEVTKAQWQAVMGTQPWSGHDHVRDDASTSATHVTWDATQGFVGELNARGEGRFRLPTEAEWEYACRAGSTTAYSFGDDVSQLGAYGWYGANTWSVDEKYAHTPGQKLPNTWGLYDMHGNVWEWCQDWYAQEYPSGSVSDPTGPGSGSHRIMRGGGWRNVLPSYRSANRFRGMQADLSARLGFRVCRNADE